MTLKTREIRIASYKFCMRQVSSLTKILLNQCFDSTDFGASDSNKILKLKQLAEEFLIPVVLTGAVYCIAKDFFGLALSDP